MSDTNTNTTDGAIDVLRERERQLDIEAQTLTARRDEVRELIAILTSRRPRSPRKPRIVEAAPAVDHTDAAPAVSFSFTQPEAAA